jgi:hypothetical protein
MCQKHFRLLTLADDFGNHQLNKQTIHVKFRVTTGTVQISSANPKSAWDDLSNLFPLTEAVPCLRFFVVVVCFCFFLLV